jgi:hypothetical protein
MHVSGDEIKGTSISFLGVAIIAEFLLVYSAESD